MRRAIVFSMMRILVLALCGIFITCEHPTFPPSSGLLTAKVNGRSWEHTYYNAYHTLKLFARKNDSCPSTVRYVLNNVLYDERIVWQEQLMFTNIPPKPGRYSLTSELLGECDTSNKIACLLLSQMELDVGGDSFIVLENEENYFDIQHFNTKTGEIKGEFKCTFVLKPPRRFKKVFPDTLRFTDGSFYSKLGPSRYPH